MDRRLDLDERRVLRAVEAGLSGERLSTEVGLAPEQARAHLRSAVVKLGARFNLDAQALADRLGHAPSPDALAFGDPRRRRTERGPTAQVRATG